MKIKFYPINKILRSEIPNCLKNYLEPWIMPYLARPIHILCDAHQAIPFTMPCPPDHTIYHAMPARPYHKHVIPPGHTIRVYHPIPRKALPYTMPCLSGHTIYHARPARQYHISCHTHKTIAYTMPCPQGHTLIPCHACQAIPYTMPGTPSHTIYHVIHVPDTADRPYQMPCPPSITI